VDSGLRAQLVSQSLVSGQMSVNLDYRPDIPAQQAAYPEDTFEIPTIPSDIQNLKDELLHNDRVAGESRRPKGTSLNMETIGNDLRQMQRTPLAASHVEALRAAGKVVTFSARVFLTRPGEPMDRFVYIEEGEVEVVDPYTDERHLPFTLGPTQFMGEISFLNGGVWSMSMRTVRDTRAIVVPREAMLTLISRIPEMSDIIITVFSARRRRQIDERDGSLRLIGEDEDRNVRRIAVFASRNRIPYTSLALGSPEAEATATSCSIAPAQPAVIFGRGVVVADPTRPNRRGAFSRR
jgi:thioredoxin reductase (NADPH)